MKKGEVELMNVHTKENQSDALMKVLSKDSFQRCVARMDLLRRDEFIRTWKYQGGECELRSGTPKSWKYEKIGHGKMEASQKKNQLSYQSSETRPAHSETELAQLETGSAQSKTGSAIS